MAKRSPRAARATRDQGRSPMAAIPGCTQRPRNPDKGHWAMYVPLGSVIALLIILGLLGFLRWPE